KLLAYTDATLVFDSTNKTESLIMPFADWYDVRITRYGKNGTSFNFSNYSGGDDKWKITDDVYKQQFDVTYFSATGLPVEAVAYFGYVNKNTDDNELIFNGAFGGITDETYIPNIENYKFDISGVDFSLTNPERDEKIVFTTNDNGHIVSANLDGEIVFADENTDDNDASLVARGYNVFFERPGGGYNNYISPTPINSDEELHNFLVTIMTKQGESTQEIDYVKNLTLNDVEIKTINYSMSVQMLGANTGLKYTDIAFISLTENEGNESKTEYAYAVGGDLNKKITNVVVPNGENLSFKGTVYAAVNDLFTSDDDAELVFDTETKTETLSMNLDKWYNVMITKNGNSVAFNFSNPDNKTFDYMLNDNAEIKSEKFDTVYYGEDNIPFEATANFGYVEEYWDEEYNEYEINFLGVFGGKKQ
ncbi:MAG: hypothetical protein IKB59_03940, partial [Alphaproteobacteria bacterium]|nr:hypothetical protein [Alphaproteobacteria bacterium]